jgi:exonuclease III
MDNSHHRNWNVLNWNVRGLNASDKCNALRDKIEESSCAIYCIQETKIQSLEPSAIRKFAPKRFNKFAYVPSQGASGGLLGEVLSSSKFQIIVRFTSTHNAEQWILSTVYGPCNGRDRQNFVDWLNNLQIDDVDNSMILGDFNFYRSLENRNRRGATFKTS